MKGMHGGAERGTAVESAFDDSWEERAAYCLFWASRALQERDTYAGRSRGGGWGGVPIDDPLLVTVMCSGVEVQHLAR